MSASITRAPGPPPARGAPAETAEPSSRAGSAPLARWILVLFAAGIPLDVPIANHVGSTSAVLGVPLAAAAVWQVVSTGRVRGLSASLACLVAFTAWSAVTGLWARETVAFTTAVETRIQLLAFVLLSWQVLRAHQDVRAMLGGFLAGCALTAADVWRAFLFTGEWRYQGTGRYAAQGFDPNEMATTLAIGIPAATYFAIRAGGVRRLSLLLYVPLATSGIVLSASRGGTLAAAVAIVCALPLIARRGRALLALTLVLLAVAAAAAWRTLPETSFTRLVTIQEELSGGTLGDRLQIWRAGVEVLKDHPVLGVGAGGFPSAVAPALAVRAAAHNTLLAIAVEAGSVGLLTFLATLALAARASWRVASEERLLSLSLLLTWGVGAAALSWDYQKTTWFVVLVCAAIGALPRSPRAASRLAPLEAVP